MRIVARHGGCGRRIFVSSVEFFARNLSREARLESYVRSLASRRGISPTVVMDGLKAANPTGRVGDPREFGAMCAFICSTHAGFLTGQNILLDGGAYPGVF